MVPADYCADGRTHTREGRQIHIYVRPGIQSREPDADMVFEVAWSPHGAVYVHKPRYGSEKLEEFLGECPDRLPGRTPFDGPLDPGTSMDRRKDALMITESRVTTKGP